MAAAVGVCLVGLATACTASNPAIAIRTAAPVSTEVASVASTGSQVQIIAHPDDDLYFMAPDVQRFIAAGWRSTTVVLTAGENNGSGPLDREQYAGQRQAGLRAAYARMAGVDNSWERQSVTVAGKRVERDTLVAKPQVAVVFLNLPDGKDTMARRTLALQNLWRGEYSTVLTLVPTGSVLTEVQSYTAEELTTVLIGLMGRATVARSLDSHPDHRFPADHTDHIHAGRFTERALRGVAAPVNSFTYRGYGISDLPADLDPISAVGKSEVLGVYGRYDPDVGLEGVGSARTRRTYPRYLGAGLRGVGPSPGSSGGSPCFLAVVAGSVRVWTADSAPPQIVGGPQLATPLAAVRQADGELRVFALRLLDFHVVTAAQTGSGLFTSWTDLGNPDPWSPYEVGSPEAVIDPSGTVYLFAKNYRGGVSMRTMAPGDGWTEWLDLDGTGVVESVTAAITADGLVELYAPTTAGIQRWESPSPGAPPVLQPVPLDVVPAGPIAAVASPDGRMQIFYRAAGNTTVRSIWRAADGRWHGPAYLGSAPGYGPVAAATSGGRVSLVASNPDYQFSIVYQSIGSVLVDPPWRNLPGEPGQQSALGVDQYGRFVAGVLGADGQLRVHAQGAVIVSSPYRQRLPS